MGPSMLTTVARAWRVQVLLQHVPLRIVRGSQDRLTASWDCDARGLVSTALVVALHSRATALDGEPSQLFRTNTRVTLHASASAFLELFLITSDARRLFPPYGGINRTDAVLTARRQTPAPMRFCPPAREKPSAAVFPARR